MFALNKLSIAFSLDFCFPANSRELPLQIAANLLERKQPGGMEKNAFQN